MLRRPFLPICIALFSAFALTSIASAQTTPGIPSPASAPNMGTLPQESIAWLEGLIRINTTNPPGNELAAANYIAAILEKEGIPHEVIEITPGRGTIDDKGMVIANLAAIVALKRNAVPLQRDVIFLADDDEEQGGDASIKAVIAKHWDKIASGFAINEEGRVISKNGKPLYVGIQTSEKVSMNVTVICTGTSGHASMPRPDNAVIHLSQAIAKIGDYETPVKFIPETERFFEQLAKVEDDETAKWIRALEQPSRQSLAVKRVSEMNPAWNSMMRDTIAPTMLQAGVRMNVIPSEARANLNIRLLPGDSINDVLADLKKVVNDPQISFEVVPNGGTPSPPSSLESPLYKTIQQVSEQEFPGIVTMPYMSTGATDSAQLRLHNVQAYGLLPFPLAEEEVLRMHADDERIPVDSFRKGVEFLYRIVNDFVARK